MKITLNNLIKKYYNQMEYLGTSHNKNGKQFIQVGNQSFAESLIFHYDNLKLIRTRSEYAPEIKKLFITLK